jgi:hypothetical protein
MMERRSYRITGQVQGVGFRWWTRKMASDMNLRGTVRNAGWTGSKTSSGGGLPVPACAASIESSPATSLSPPGSTSFDDPPHSFFLASIRAFAFLRSPMM